MKKLLTAAAVVAALLLAAFAVLSLAPRDPRRGPPRLAAVCRGAGPLRAGAGVEPLRLPDAPSIAGFARWRWAAEGQRDPLAARALVVAEGGCAVGLVSLEILLVPPELASAVEAKGRALGLDQVIVAATHTHAGPGGYWDSPLGSRLATGPFEPRALEALVEAAGRALAAARSAQEPATLEVGLGDGGDLVANRDGGEVDGHLVSARLAARGGATIAEVAIFGAHPTILGMRNRALSGDWPGALMRARPAPLLFLQGAIGDQTTHGDHGEAASPESYAQALDGLLAAAPRSAPDAAPRLAAARAVVPLPPPSPGVLPGFLRPAAGRLLGGALPAEAAVTALRLGPVLLVVTPAEPTAAVAEDWRRAAGGDAEVVSLAGPYAGYVETAERMARGQGETGRTYYGPELAARLQEAVALAARSADGARAAR